ncbi:MAG: amino acid adenylation domain-containing protein, partial [Cyanobacteria bacterium J06558_2]
MSAETLQGFQLSPQQKHLWSGQQDNNITLSQAIIEVTGKVDLIVLRAAIQKIVDRQEILRTNFYRKSGVSIPFQVIAETRDVFWQSIELKDVEQQEIELKIAELSDLEKSAQFNLEGGSLFRLKLLNLNDECHYLIITLPALCADSQTINNLLQELSLSYSYSLQGQDFVEEPVQYTQFSEWQNELLTESSKAGQDYWQQQQSINYSLVFPDELIYEHNLAKKLNRYSLKLERELFNQASLIATKYNTSLSNLFLACWYILISKLTKISKINIANIFSARNYEELADILGLVEQFLPVSCIVTPQNTFPKILSTIEDNLEEVGQYQEDFFQKNSREKVNGIGMPLIGFEFEELPQKYSANGVSFALYHKDIQLEDFKLKLTCQQQPDCLIVCFYYEANRFTPETIDRLAQQFSTLVESVVHNTEATVEELNILNHQQRHQLLVEFNDNEVKYSQAECLHQLFEAQVSKTPNNTALVYNSEQLTYDELNQQAEKLACYLQQLGVTAESIVGLYIERSHLPIIGLLGILKAGGAYLPLDSALPPEGLAFRLEDAGVSVVLTQRSLEAKIPSDIVQSICLDTDWEAITGLQQNNLKHQVKSDNLAYTIYTSGSTGTPKAVAVEHKQIVNYVHSIIERLDFLPGASFATVSTLAADLGNTMLFPALCTGGCLHLVDQEIAADPQAFAQYCQDHPIDYLKIVPSHLSALLASSPTAEFLPRKKLILGGEASNWQLIAKVRQQQPECQILNHYGPTETTVGVLTYPIQAIASKESTTVPIGKPLPNNQVYILDDQLKLVPLGVSGELYIGGVQVSRGYLNRPELTQERFIPNPFLNQQPDLEPQQLYKTGDLVKYLTDGNIEFLGRIDRQVKIRGFRIELGEVESRLGEHEGIQSVTVVADERALNNKRLIAYVVTRDEFRQLHQRQDSAIASELRSFCLTRFPEYMIPAAFIVLKALPLTANGKIDYQALPDPEQARSQLSQNYVAPRSSLEEKLAEIWSEILNLKRIGVHDNFFELGGHSLLVTQLLAKVRASCEIDLPLKVLFDAPNIADLAEKIEKIFEAGGDASISSESEKVDLSAEIFLDPEIVPGGNPVNITATPKSILITGATGFLGAFLLHELLQQTTADIYCLIRAENKTQAKERIENKLKSYLLWDDGLSQRIIPLVGDLAQPLLGLSIDNFNAIAEKVDVIYHNGAWVNFTYPYSQLKAANVSGTQEVLRLAVQSKVKPVH